MKKIVIGIIILSAFFVSCTDWLAVKPFDALEQDDVFLNERNTNTALNGIYLSLAMPNLYAKEMSCGMLDALAQHYITPINTEKDEHPYYRLANFAYDHENAKNKLNNVFRAAYESIGDCNEFIEKVEANKLNYSEAKYRIYIGEAIAVRTLLHFDMLRLFGPKGDELDRMSVPYCNVSTHIPQPILTANELVDKLIEDIDTAIEYLSDDPILYSGKRENGNLTQDFFADFRNTRMNYYAVNALKARICLYKGTAESMETAYAIATNLIESKNPSTPTESTNFSECFKFSKSTEYQVYPEELIFALHNKKRDELNKTLFTLDLLDRQILGCGHAFLGYLYGHKFAGDETSTAANAPGGMDPGPRYQMFAYESIRKLCTYKRFNVNIIQYPYRNEYQSMIRLGELYLIAAETAPTVDLKRSWVEKLRTGKGYDPGNANGLTETQLNTLISVEFEKETFGEGQYFFYAKRKSLNLRNPSNGNVTMSRGTFVPPLPDIESDYRTDMNPTNSEQ